MRSFNINVSAFMEGGTKEDLGKIPVFKYKAPTNEDIERCDQGTSAQPQLENTESRTKPERKANFIKRWMKRHTTTMAEKEEEQQEIEYLTISRSENALCSICLCEYENEDLICKLWCNHIYHRDCVKEWLSLNAKCPLCKRDFRGKHFIQSESVR